MEEITKAITSPSWWILAVLFGIIINLVSAYIKDPLDRAMVAIGVHQRFRTKARMEAHTALLKLLSESEEARQYYLLVALKLRARSNGWLLVAVLVLCALLLEESGSIFASSSILSNSESLIHRIAKGIQNFFIIGPILMSVTSSNSALYYESAVESTVKVAHSKGAA